MIDPEDEYSPDLTSCTLCGTVGINTKFTISPSYGSEYDLLDIEFLTCDDCITKLIQNAKIEPEIIEIPF